MCAFFFHWIPFWNVLYRFCYNFFFNFKLFFFNNFVITFDLRISKGINDQKFLIFYLKSYLNSSKSRLDWTYKLYEWQGEHYRLRWTSCFLVSLCRVYSHSVTLKTWGCHGRDCNLVVGFTTTYPISASRLGRSVQHYVIKFVSDLRQVVGFLRVLRFPPPINLTATM